MVYRAKKIRIVSMSQYLWTWLYTFTNLLKTDNLTVVSDLRIIADLKVIADDIIKIIYYGDRLIRKFSLFLGRKPMRAVTWVTDQSEIDAGVSVPGLGVAVVGFVNWPPRGSFKSGKRRLSYLGRIGRSLRNGTARRATRWRQRSHSLSGRSPDLRRSPSQHYRRSCYGGWLLSW